MTERESPARVRIAKTAADWSAIRSLCCRTGNAGEPIARERWPLFEELWIGPYQRLVPDWTYVAEVDGRIVGYLTGCPDTAALRHAGRFRVTLRLLAGIACGRYAWTVDARRAVSRAFRIRRGTEARLAPQLPADLPRTHPAHLHMNVEAEYRSRGIGAALIQRYARDLTAAGVPGVYLVCGASPRAFYERNSFREMGKIEASPGRWIYTLGRRLVDPAGR